MYSVVLMACMSTAPETENFGDIWAKHCFWESCLPARYGWLDCGPAYRPYYPASYTSCCGIGGYSHGCYSSCHGWGACHGCYSSCYGCGGCWGSWWGGAIHYSGCSGAYYSCYGGGAAGLYSGIGYAGFGAFGNYGMYGTLPVYAAPVYATPLFDAKPEIKPVDPKIEVKPVDVKPEIKPVIRPLQTNNSVPAKATVVVKVPANAKVYIDDNLMHSTSAERTFTSPALETGQSYYYTIRVVTEKDGKEVADVRQVTVRGGEVSRLDFDNVYDRVRPDDRTIVDSTRNPIK